MGCLALIQPAEYALIFLLHDRLGEAGYEPGENSSEGALTCAREVVAASCVWTISRAGQGCTGGILAGC
jgi:hypothetical protein